MTETEVLNPHVKAAIDFCGGKQSLLAERLECAQQTVSKLLRGEIEIDPTWAVRLSRATEGRLKAAEACPALAAIVDASPPQAPDNRDDDQHQHADERAAADAVDTHEVLS